MPSDPTLSLIDQTILSLLDSAVESEVGITVDVSVLPGRDVIAPVLRVKQIFYRFRKECRPAYDGIQIRLSPTSPDTELWLIKRSPTERRGRGRPATTYTITAEDFDDATN